MVPLVDWVLALVGAFCAGYLFLFYASSRRGPASPTRIDIIAASTGVVIMLEATRRAVGMLMTVLATCSCLVCSARTCPR